MKTVCKEEVNRAGNPFPPALIRVKKGNSSLSGVHGIEITGITEEERNKIWQFARDTIAPIKKEAK